MFAPRWKKEARLLHKGARKFLNYKRDLLEDDKIGEIEAGRAQLLAAVKSGDREGAAEAEKILTKTCEQALPRYRRQSAIEENIEVFFVAIVIALGIRAYYLQPFRIPTGSMQPTLNGINGGFVEKKDFPSWPRRGFDFVFKGRNYIHNQLDRPRTFATSDLNKAMRQVQKWNFFTYTHLYFTDGVVTVHAPKSVLLDEMGLGRKLGVASREGIQLTNTIPNERLTLPAGTVLASGYTDSGDLVLVDKVSYNFRRPKRGEVYVFDTRGIRGIHKRSGPQGAGSHYIKRLAGVPGDELQIVDGKLLIDGEPAPEKRLQMVMNATGPYEGEATYQLAARGNSPEPVWIDSPGDRVPLATRADLLKAGKGPVDSYLYREYFALGDNTDNSLDSRYWGPVKDYNLVGPALFSLWPITSGHWGFIR